MVMVMPVMMMAHRVCRYGQPTQDNQSYNSEKHGADLHDETSFLSAASLPDGLIFVQPVFSNPGLHRNVFPHKKIFHA